MQLWARKGPEIVRLPRGSDVIPNHEVMQLPVGGFYGGGGSQVGGVSQTIVIEMDGETIAKKVIPRWTRDVRLQGV